MMSYELIHNSSFITYNSMKPIIFNCLALTFLLIGSSLILLSILAIGYDFSQPLLGDIINQSRPLDLNTPDPALQGQLISITGQLSTSEKLSDDLYLKPAPYLELTRKVEMYAWVQRSRKANSTSAYDQYWVEAWTNNPAKDSRNPEMTIKPATWRVSQIHIGAYTLDPKELDLPVSDDVTLTFDLLSQPAPLADGYLFHGKGSLDAPEIGDFRLWYEAVPVPNRMVTVYGKLEGQKIVPFPYGDGYPTVYHVRFGDRETSLVTLSQQAVIATWIWRCLLGVFAIGGLGFIAAAVAMWFSSRK
jgi:hypothetical protein